MTFKIPGGSSVYFGAPAQPLSPEIQRGIADGLSAIPEIIEAHLPMCFVPKMMQQPMIILVIVVKPGTEAAAVMPAVAGVIQKVLPSDKFLDVWPVAPGHPLLEGAAQAGCRLIP